MSTSVYGNESEEQNKPLQISLEVLSTGVIPAMYVTINYDPNHPESGKIALQADISPKPVWSYDDFLHNEPHGHDKVNGIIYYSQYLPRNKSSKDIEYVFSVSLGGETATASVIIPPSPKFYTVYDALEILKYLAGIPNKLRDGVNYNNVMPTIHDALDILKLLAGV